MPVETALHCERPIPAAYVVRLYREAGWWPERTASAVTAVLAAGPAAGAWDGERLVGFARLVTDGAFRAFLEDVVVSASHRRRGVASELVAALLDDAAGVDVVTTFCDETLVPLYEAAGFRRTRQVVLHRESAGNSTPHGTATAAGSSGRASVRARRGRGRGHAR